MRTMGWCEGWSDVHCLSRVSQRNRERVCGLCPCGSIEPSPFLPIEHRSTPPPAHLPPTTNGTCSASPAAGSLWHSTSSSTTRTPASSCSCSEPLSPPFRRPPRDLCVPLSLHLLNGCHSIPVVPPLPSPWLLEDP